MTETTRSITNVLFLTSSFVVGTIGVLVCLLARNVFMKSPADWLTIDYTMPGWWLRIFAAMAGLGGLVLALISLSGVHKRPVRRFVYRTDVTIALISIAFEIAFPVILVILIFGIIGVAASNSIDSKADATGCLAGSLDLFDFED